MTLHLRGYWLQRLHLAFWEQFKRLEPPSIYANRFVGGSIAGISVAQPAGPLFAANVIECSFDQSGCSAGVQRGEDVHRV